MSHCYQILSHLSQKNYKSDTLHTLHWVIDDVPNSPYFRTVADLTDFLLFIIFHPTVFYEEVCSKEKLDPYFKKKVKNIIKKYIFMKQDKFLLLPATGFRNYPLFFVVTVETINKILDFQK